MQIVPGATFRGGAATRVHAPYVSEAGGRVGVAFPVGVSPVFRFGNEVQFYVTDVQRMSPNNFAYFCIHLLVHN